MEHLKHQICCPEGSECSWSPVFVFVNTKSGSRDGEEMLHAFRRLLHPIQVAFCVFLEPEYAKMMLMFQNPNKGARRWSSGSGTRCPTVRAGSVSTRLQGFGCRWRWNRRMGPECSRARIWFVEFGATSGWCRSAGHRKRPEPRAGFRCRSPPQVAGDEGGAEVAGCTCQVPAGSD